MECRTQKEYLRSAARESHEFGFVPGSSCDEKASFPKDFIAQLLTIGEPGPDLTVLEWFPIQFGDTSGYYGFGCTRQELELPENARARRFVRIGMDRHMDSCLPSEERHEDAY